MSKTNIKCLYVPIENALKYMEDNNIKGDSWFNYNTQVIVKKDNDIKTYNCNRKDIIDEIQNGINERILSKGRCSENEKYINFIFKNNDEKNQICYKISISKQIKNNLENKKSDLEDKFIDEDIKILKKLCDANIKYNRRTIAKKIGKGFVAVVTSAATIISIVKVAKGAGEIYKKEQEERDRIESQYFEDVSDDVKQKFIENWILNGDISHINYNCLKNETYKKELEKYIKEKEKEKEKINEEKINEEKDNQEEINTKIR